MERGQERVGDRGVDRGAAGPQVPDAAAVDDVAAGAVVAGGGLGRPVVVDGRFPAAVPAGGKALAQGAALPDRAGAGLVGLGADVAGQAGLAGLVGVPVDEALVVAGDEHLPLVLGQHAAPLLQGAILAQVLLLAGTAAAIGAGVWPAGPRGG